MSRSTAVVIVGAGLSGLIAADLLRQEGIEVLVVEKSRGVGGRMATRRIGDAVFDHGAQFITVRDSEFARSLSKWSSSGSVEEWFRSGGSGNGHTRFRGSPSMTAIAKELSRSVDVQLADGVNSLIPLNSLSQLKGPGSVRNEKSAGRAAWFVTMESGETIIADAVLLTAPVPQSLALLDAGEAILPRKIRQELEAISYHPCIAVMACLQKQSALPEQGYTTPSKGPIAWIADNQIKGISPVPAVTIHAGAGFSEEHWHDDRQQIGEQLVSAAQQWLGCGVDDVQVHAWRYSKPHRGSSQLCLGTRPLPANMKAEDEDHPNTSDPAALPPVVFAGDAFGGPRVEGAFLSGRAAAAYIIQTMDLPRRQVHRNPDRRKDD